MVFQGLFDFGFGEARGVKAGLDEVGGVGLGGWVVFSVFGVDGVGKGGADGSAIHGDDTGGLDADHGGFEVSNFLGDGIFDSEGDGLV